MAGHGKCHSNMQHPLPFQGNNFSNDHIAYFFLQLWEFVNLP